MVFLHIVIIIIQLQDFCIVCLCQEMFMLYLCYRVPSELFDIMLKKGDGDWLTETKKLTLIKRYVYEEIVTMSPRFYW